MYGVYPARLVKDPQAVVRRLYSEYGAQLEPTGEQCREGEQSYVLFRNKGSIETANRAIGPFKAAGELLNLVHLAPSLDVRLRIISGPALSLSASELCEAVMDTEGVTLLPSSASDIFTVASIDDATCITAAGWKMMIAGGLNTVGFSPVWKTSSPAVVSSPAATVSVAPIVSSCNVPVVDALVAALQPPRASGGGLLGSGPLAVEAPVRPAATAPESILVHREPAVVQQIVPRPPVSSVSRSPAPTRAPPSSPLDLSGVYVLHDAESCPISQQPQLEQFGDGIKPNYLLQVSEDVVLCGSDVSYASVPH
jgi:hypothetical protein